MRRGTERGRGTGLREHNHGVSAEVGGRSGLTTHLRPTSQEVFAGHEGLFAAQAKSGEPFFLRLSEYLPSRSGVPVCPHVSMIRIRFNAKALTAA